MLEDPENRPVRSTPNPLRWLAAVIAAVLVVYLASPYYSTWGFLDALNSRDTAALAARVNFPEVRETMKRQLRAHFFPDKAEHAKKNRLESIIKNLGPSLIDQLVDAYITPDGLVALIANPNIVSASDRPRMPSLDSGGGLALPRSDWSKVRYAFFTGPRDFLLDVNGTKLRFRLSGFRWLLHQVDLPLDAPADRH